VEIPASENESNDDSAYRDPEHKSANLVKSILLSFGKSSRLQVNSTN
jgi:hypothetical protein